VAHPVTLATWEPEIWSIIVPGHLRQIVQENPIFKITGRKWTEGVAQVVKHLLCKCEALSWNTSPTRKKIKKENKRPYLPSFIYTLIIFLSLYHSEFLIYIFFFLFEELLFILLARHGYWQQIPQLLFASENLSYFFSFWRIILQCIGF
jgi:hypothetical protein